MTAPSDPKALTDGHSRYVGHRPATCCYLGYYDGGGGWWCCNSPQNSEVEQLRRCLAEVERERDEWKAVYQGLLGASPAVLKSMGTFERGMALRRQLEAAERDLAAAREAVSDADDFIGWIGANTDGDVEWPPAREGQFERSRARVRAALSPATKEME